MGIVSQNRQYSLLSSVLVCINSFELHEPVGVLYTVTQPEPIAFNGAIQLCNIMDEYFTANKAPQQTHEYRSFSSKKQKSTEENTMAEIITQSELPNENGQKGTFIVYVQFRQNASWQGQIQWVDGKKTQKFRSTLEMLKLIDEAVGGEEDATPIWDE